MLSLRARTAWIIFPAMAVFLIHGFLIKLTVRDRKLRRQKLLRNTQIYSRFALRRMRVKVRTKGLEELSDENFLIACNHMSYLDMLVLATLYPSVFVTSVDMGQVPFLGTMAEIGGSLFVERRHRQRIEYDIWQIEETLAHGFNVTLFPEGTSGNAEAVAPFKRSLLTAAVWAGRRIRPVTLKYVEVSGHPLSTENRDTVCWYGRMPFLSHFLNLMGAESVVAEVVFHEPKRFDRDTPKETIATRVYDTVAMEYGSPILAEARSYATI